MANVRQKSTNSRTRHTNSQWFTTLWTWGTHLSSGSWNRIRLWIYVSSLIISNLCTIPFFTRISNNLFFIRSWIFFKNFIRKRTKLGQFCPLGPFNNYNYEDKMRGGGGQKMSVFVHAQGMKTVHEGGQKMAKFCPHSCWMLPNPSNPMLANFNKTWPLPLQIEDVLNGWSLDYIVAHLT